MATYLGTHGSRIQNYTTDPDNPNTGEVWYNETSNALKFQHPNITTTGSWATAGTMNTAREETAAAGKTSTSALVFGGNQPARSNASESWNGTCWSNTPNMTTAREK